MATIIKSRGVGLSPIIERRGQKKRKVGRWCKAPQKPDVCYFCPIGNCRHATHYITINGWRYGYCGSHKAKTYAYKRDILKEKRGR